MSSSATTATPPVAPAAARPHHHRSPWPTFAIASVAVFLVSVDATVLYAAFPALRAAFADATAADLSWVLNAYTVVYAAMLVPAGRLADLYGRKRVFTTGVAIFLLASLGCGLAGTVGLLVAMRALQAVGAALLLPASLSIVLAAFPISRRAIAVSAWGAVSGVAAAFGPSAGAWLIERGGWPWAFFINLPIGGLALLFGLRRLPESRNPDNAAPLDVVGVLLLIVGVGAIAYGLVRSEALGWASAWVSGAIVLGIAALALFVAWAKRAPAPAIDLALFAERSYRFVNLAMLSYGAAFAMMFFTFFFYMTEVWHLSLPEAGLRIVPGPLLVVPSSIVSGRIAAKIGHKALLVGGNLLFAAGGLWYLLVPGTEVAYWSHWFPGMVMTGVATGMVMPSLAAAAVARLHAKHFGIGGAVNQAVRQVGTVLGVALTVVLIGHPSPTLAEFRQVFGAEIALALLAALLCAPVDTRPRR